METTCRAGLPGPPGKRRERGRTTPSSDGAPATGTSSARPVYVGPVLLDRLDLSPAELVERTGWEIKPEGACKGDICVPLRGPVARPDGAIDVEALASQLEMPSRAR